MQEKKPHVHAELIKAWADGAVIQFLYKGGEWWSVEHPNWMPDREYRIKPQPHKWQKEMDAFERGETVEIWVHGNGWGEVKTPTWSPDRQYRIKPKDFTYGHTVWTGVCDDSIHIRVTYDGTTGKPKSAELA